MITHFGNGAPKMVPRHNNILISGLAEEKLWVSLITDGKHIPDSLIKVALKNKGIDKVVIVSDIAPPAGTIIAFLIWKIFMAPILMRYFD